MNTVGPAGRRKALLVIHGVGKQAPLRSLGAFVQGLTRAARRGAADPTSAPTAFIVELAGRPRPLVRLPSATPDGHQLDVIEYHWADHSVGRISSAATFAWLLEVTLAGIDFRRQLPFLLKAASARGAFFLVFRQLLQVCALAGAAALLMVAGLLVAARAPQALVALQGAAARLPQLPGLPQMLALALLVCLLLASSALARDLLLARWEALSLRRLQGAPPAAAWSGLHAAAAARWALPGLALLCACVAASLGIGWLIRDLLAAYLAASGHLLAEPGVSVALATLLAALLGRRLLLSHVSDVALYVTSDRVSSRARTRRAILDEGQALLTDLLESGYEAVYVAGHSLGSVVALDLLDRLARRPPRAGRIGGLLTFGSPLDKVAYFFRQRPAEGEAVRAQLLGFLHGVRRRPDLRDHGPYALAPTSQPFEEMEWLQVHAPGDLLSDRLVHYRVDRRVVLPRFNPFTAHGAYWRDDRFYQAALEWLHGPAVAEAENQEADPVLL